MLRSVCAIDLRIAPVERVTTHELAEMWRLYAPHHNIAEAEFHARARDRIDEMALFRTRGGGDLVGFTGLRRWRGRLSTGVVSAMYVGQTFIAEAFRGHDLIQRTVIAVLLRSWRRHPSERLFFWADCLSYKPYLLAARNLRRIHPSPQWPTPPDVHELIDVLGARYYPDTYDPATGTVRKSAALLQPHVAPIDEAMCADPFIAYYAARNPGHVRGDGLLAVYPGTLENLRHFVVRRLRQAVGVRA